MKKLKAYFISIIFDSALIGCWVYGIQSDNENLINIPVFWMWLCVPLMFLMLFVDDAEISKKSPFINWASFIGDFALVIMAIYTGWIVTAAFYASCAILYYGKRQNGIKALSHKEGE